MESRHQVDKRHLGQLAELIDYAAWIVVIAIVVTVIVWIRILTGLFGLLGKTIWRQ